MSQFWFERFPREHDKFNKLFLSWSETEVFKRHVKESKAIIEDALSKFPKWHLAYSGGKDSTAVLGLLWEMGLNKEVELFNIYDDRAFSFHKAYVEMMAKKFNFNLDIRYLGEVLKEDFLLDEKSSGQLKNLKEKIDFLRAEKNKNSGVFMGLRIEESKKRRFLYSKNAGIATRRENGSWYCNPIMRWSGNDVFAFLLSRNIPIIDVYRKLDLWPDPRKIRYHDATPRNFASEGQAAWLRENYPLEFKRLVESGHEELLKY